jgi:hypothetical protein
MDFGRKNEEKRLVRSKRRWVDNKINGYNNYIMFEKVVLKVAKKIFLIYFIFIPYI